MSTVRNIWHAVQYDPRRAHIDRVQRAKATWHILYRNGGVFPAHMTKYTRSAKDIGDRRDLPYLKDLLAHAMEKAQPDDIILFSNDDNHLHPALPDYLRYHVSLFGACGSFRFEHNGPIDPIQQNELYCQTHSAGQDIFAFTKTWLQANWNEIPDFLLGASEWDWCLTMIIRKEKGIKSTQENIRYPIFPAEIPMGYVAHEAHKPGWIEEDTVNAAPSQVHNKKLFAEWLAKNNPTFKMNSYKGTPAPRHSANGKEILVVRRSNALGDVLASTCVATKLMEQGHEVEFQAHHSAHCLLRRMRTIKTIMEPTGEYDINLDGVYENHPERRRRHFADLFIERANEFLAKRGIARIPSVTNFAPRIFSEPGVMAEVMPRLERFPLPWVMICPRSQSWANRTIPNEVWADAVREIQGTKFWLGFNGAPPGVEDLFCRHLDHCVEYIAAADLLVTVDTGPAHIAAALGTPMVVIEQASAPALHFSDQRDWTVVRSNLDCLNCQKDLCPINHKYPPCQQINPRVIAAAANARLRHYTTNDISAIVAVYRPNIDHLNKALAHILPQVQEVVIVHCLDTPADMLRGIPQDGKIKIVQRPSERTGYGKKVNYGARHSNGKYLWFTQDDCFPNPDVATELRRVLDSDATTGMVSYTLRYPDGTIQYSGKFRPTGHVGFGHIDHRGTKVRFTTPVERESLCGASVMLKRQAFFDASGFDEDYYLYSEDDDLSLRMRRAGYRLMFTPNVEGVHIEHVSTGKSGNIQLLCQRSNELFAQKWKWYFDRNPDVTKIGTFGV